MKLTYIEIEQPIGTFYLTSIPASRLIPIVKIPRRSEDPERGIQRQLDPDRVKAISRFCSDPDAMFPTPIVISINENIPYNIDKQARTIHLPDGLPIGYVIDGQHRLEGIKQSELAEKFDLPVCMMFGLTGEEMAYVFSTINSTQKSVSMSLIYDLFDLSRNRSPYKTAHNIARVLNNKEGSALKGRLKMLGRKTPEHPYATLSQGTFVKNLVRLISVKPDEDMRKIIRNEELEPNENLPLRKYFLMEKDEVILKIFENCFNALRNVFREEWNYPESNILWKTTGFCAVLYSLNYILRIGISENELTQSFFENVFTSFKEYTTDKGISLTSKDFPGGGEQNQKKLSKILNESIDLSNKWQTEYSGITSDYQKFVSDIIDDMDYNEKFELCEAIDRCDSSILNCFICKPHPQQSETSIIIHPSSDTTLILKHSDREACINWIEKTYLDDMDYETWYGYEYAINKDD